MAYLFCGILLVIDATLLLLYGDFRWRGVIVPQWVGWPKLFLGIVFCCLSYRLRVNSTQSHEEDVEKAEVEMDAMYLKEHGEPPQKPKQ